MSLSDRRFQRYTLTPGAFSLQRMRGTGFFASIGGWKACRVKDMSSAGALILAKQEYHLGALIDIELQTTDGVRMVFRGEVVNLGKDHKTSENKIGVRIHTPDLGSVESTFLENLGKKFREIA